MKDPLSAIMKEKGNRLCTVLPTITVDACIQKMNTEKIGAILVVDSTGQLVGMFTERDVLNKIFPQQIDIKKTTVDKVMTTKLVYAKPTSTVEEAMATFTERRFRHLPVLENDKLVGLVSIGDATKWVLRSLQEEINYLSNYISGKYK